MRLRSRRLMWLAVPGLLAMALPASLRAADDEVRVPVALQAELLSKVARYDQNLSARAGDTLRILVLHRKDDSQSATLAKQLKTALQSSPVLTDRPQDTAIEPMTTPAEVAGRCGGKKVAILVLSSGFTPAEVRALAAALSGRSVLTLGLSAKAAEAGTVLSFDLVASRPKIVVNLKQARAQEVQLASALLALAKVVQ